MENTTYDNSTKNLDSKSSEKEESSTYNQEYEDYGWLNDHCDGC